MMDESRALTALTAMAHETRLALVRLLVAAGCAGLAQGEIARRLDISASRLAFHLNLLEKAGLVRARRESRNVLYAADMAGIGAVLGYVLRDCCGGHPEIAECCQTGHCARSDDI